MNHKHQIKLTWLLAISLSVNLIILLFSIVVVQKKGGLTWLSDEIQLLSSDSGSSYAMIRREIYNSLPIENEDVVFLGDSILVFDEWHVLMGTPFIKNRAIAGDDTSSLLSRLDSIISAQPADLIIEIGINDLQLGRSVKQTEDNYTHIIKNSLATSDSTRLWLLPLFPVNKFMYSTYFLPEHPYVHTPNRSDVDEINEYLRRTANHLGPRVQFIDIPDLIDDSNELKKEYTPDGVHLNRAGLDQIARRLKQSMRSRKPSRVRASQ